ncbi:unnamed protein product [Rotaria magnacalcarata]|uniref:Uncharacterized protein n=1 Tax=Rotaria magnacalcarata TaxID=392030 RepID=A0A816BYJ2_9BILA|nr:unnamed protein product [Rotaria magnacalcarata]
MVVTKSFRQKKTSKRYPDTEKNLRFFGTLRPLSLFQELESFRFTIFRSDLKINLNTTKNNAGTKNILYTSEKFDYEVRGDICNRQKLLLQKHAPFGA